MPSPSPSPSPSPPEDIVATTMGFSSFGAKPNPPKKKRKLALDPNNNGEEGSGSNNTPLGVRTRKPAGDSEQEKNNVGGEERKGEEEDSKGRQQSQAMGQGMVHGSLERGRGRGRGQRQEEQRSDYETFREQATGSNAPDPLAAAALDESAAMMLETGLLPQYLDWNEGFAAAEGGGPLDFDDDGGAGAGAGRRETFEQEGRVGGGGDESVGRQEGRRGDGGWDWQALRMGVRDERGDVAFYDKSFVEDPWRGLVGGKGGTGGEVEGGAGL